jgi:hypothetical protein
MRAPSGNDATLRIKASDSVVLGYAALGATPTPAGTNVVIGPTAAAVNDLSTIGNLIAIGSGALNAATTAAGQNIGIGTNALSKAAGLQNVAMGYTAGQNTTGAYNTLIGNAANQAATAVNYATVVGANANAAAGGVALGNGAAGSGTYGVAIGYNTTASAAGGVAIGVDSAGTSATTSTTNEFKLGTASHLYNLPGKINATLTFNDAINVALGTTTGTKFGTAITQKIGWWNAPPVVQSTGWSVTTGYTVTKAYNPASTTLNEVAAVLGTLIDQLKTYGLLGA